MSRGRGGPFHFRTGRELRAILDGLILADQRAIMELEIEADSIIAVKMIKDNQFRQGLSVYIARRCRQQNIRKVTHIFREQNKAADAFSRQAFVSGDKEYNSESLVPNGIRKIIYFDRIGIPSYRRP